MERIISKTILMIFFLTLISQNAKGNDIPKPKIIGPETVCLFNIVSYSVTPNPNYKIFWSKDNSELFKSLDTTLFSGSSLIEFEPQSGSGNPPCTGYLYAYYMDTLNHIKGPKDSIFILGLRDLGNNIELVNPPVAGCSGDFVKLHATITDSLNMPYVKNIRFIWSRVNNNSTFMTDSIADTVVLRLHNIVGKAIISVYAEVFSENIVYSCGKSKLDTIHINIRNGVDVPSDGIIEKGNLTGNENKNYLLLICPECVNNDRIDTVKWFYDSSGVIKVLNYGLLSEYGTGKAFCKFPTRNKQNIYQLQLVGKKQEGTEDRCRQTLVFTFPSDISSQYLSARIFPNPSNGNFDIMIEDDFCGQGTIRITDLVGNVRYFALFEKPTREFKYQVTRNNLSKGMYLVEIHLSNGDRLMQKIMVH